MLGVKFVVPPGAPNPPGPVFRAGLDERGFDLVLQGWAQLVHHEGSKVYLESRWHADRGQVYGIRGLEHPHTKVDVERMRRALGLVKLVQRQGRRVEKTRQQVVDAIHRRLAPSAGVRSGALRPAR